EHGVERLVRVVGPTHASDMLLSGRSLPADEALRIGMVNRVLPGDQLETVTRDYATRLADCAPLTLAAHKAAIQEVLHSTGEAGRARVRPLSNRCFNSPDYREGVQAFLAKRPPRFNGR